MNEFLTRLVQAGERLATANGLSWDVGHNATGKVAKSERWNLTALAGQVPPPNLWLTGFEFSEAELAALQDHHTPGSRGAALAAPVPSLGILELVQHLAAIGVQQSDRGALSER